MAWRWIVNTVETIGRFCSNLFGAGMIRENSYDMLEVQTILGGIETGTSDSKTIAGDVSKPISIFYQKASSWWKFTEYKLGFQINIGDGGFAYAFSLGEVESSISFGAGLTLEFFSGINKIGITATTNADFGTHEGGHYIHVYIRTIPFALGVALMVYSAYALTLVPAFV